MGGIYNFLWEVFIISYGRYLKCWTLSHVVKHWNVSWVTHFQMIHNPEFLSLACSLGCSPTRLTSLQTSRAPWWRWPTCWPPSLASSCPPLLASWLMALMAWLHGTQVRRQYYFLKNQKTIFRTNLISLNNPAVFGMTAGILVFEVVLFSIFGKADIQVGRKINENSIKSTLIQFLPQSWNNNEGRRTPWQNFKISHVFYNEPDVP